MNHELLKRFISSIILIPCVLFFIIKGSIFFNLFIFACFLITSYEWHKMSSKNSYYYLGIIFLIFSFYTIYCLRNDNSSDYAYLLAVTAICVSTDIGGYLFGKFFKGPKLTKISPKKTYSGMIGGYLLSILSIKTFISLGYLFSGSTKPSINVFIFVFLVSSVSQLGDIIISYFKRLSKIKDTGIIIPGHGGLLDRIDGMIFAFPFCYIFLELSIF